MSRQKCYDRRDKTLTFVDGEDQLDFLIEEFNSPRAAMSCGHAVTPMSLTNWCKRLIDEGNTKFSCPLTKNNANCNAEWSYIEVRKMAALTAAECMYFEETMAHNATKQYDDLKTCPGCQSLVLRKDPSKLAVRCTFCTVQRKKAYDFCWQCQREWKGPGPTSDRCAHERCNNYELDILGTCKDVVFEKVKNVSGCPSVRACPTCGCRVEHDGTRCKNITCTRCKVEFCFVCLKITTECKKSGPYSYFGPCTAGVAPRQTFIPVWQKK